MGFCTYFDTRLHPKKSLCWISNEISAGLKFWDSILGAYKGYELKTY